MKKLFTFPVIIFLVLPFSLHAQGIKKISKDPLVASMEANRKSAAPFSVIFKEEAGYKTADAQLLFTKYLSLRVGIDELRLKKTDDANGIAVTRYQQFFKGIKVQHGTYVITAKNDRVSYITGDFYTIPENTAVTPVLTENEAVQKAWNYLDGEQPVLNDAPPAELVLVENDFQAQLDGKVFLAYKFSLGSHKSSMKMEDIFVDAATGRILFIDSQVKACFGGIEKPGSKNIPVQCAESEITAAQKPTVIASGASSIYSGNLTDLSTSFVGGSFRLQTTLVGEGTPTHVRNFNHQLVTTFSTIGQYTTAMAASPEITDADNSWTAAEYANANKDNTALDAAWGAQKVYSYWLTRHGRHSWDNADGVLNLFVHADVNYNNAFWQGATGIQSMFYGDGSNTAGGFTSLTALDVTGHEIGHGVCQATSNLVYNRESGGMNEGFSDIWGAAIEHFADPHESDGSSKKYFEIGEEICTPLNGQPLRSMSNPKVAYSQCPDTYLGTYWSPTTVAGCPTPNSGTNDNCGVHTNSGVLNHWFYLMVSGGSGTNDVGNAYIVGALDWVKAEKVAYLTEQSLSSTADYAAARTASIAAATTLYGSCSVEVENVTRAWYAVNVGANYVQCAPQVGFKNITQTVAETSGSFACPATKTVTIPMQIVPSLVPAGGNAIVTVTGSGTATLGKDYMITNGTATFAAGSTADQNITLTINDDGAAEGTEQIILDFTITANGSNLTKSGAYRQMVINLTDDDKTPEDGNATVTSAAVGSYNVMASTTSPFKSSAATARSQFIWTAAELTAAGLNPNYAFKAASFTVLTKNSATAFTNYTVAFANTLQASMTGYVGSLTQVYSNNFSTVAGLNTINFTSGFIWDGTSNVVMQVCFSNAAAGTGNDVVTGYTAGATAYTGVATGATGGCTLTALATSATRPIITFIQNVPPAAIETGISSTRSFPLTIGENNYFYSSADNELIAGVTGNNQDLGCVSATVTGAGIGFVSLASSPSVKRSLKEINITPTINGSTTNYNATIYFTDAELAGKSPATLLILKTNAATDAQINGTNTVTATPTVLNGTNFKGFTGNFTGFSRFCLIDNAIALAVRGLTAEAYLENGRVYLDWKTETETNSSHFIIQRSYDGVNFSEIKQVSASGTSSMQKRYSIVDNDMPQSINYYRVQLVNANGSTMTSPIVSVKMSVKNGIAVMPNPVVDRLVIQYRGKGIISIMDATGRKMQHFTTTNATGSISADASNYSSGIYIVVFTDENNHVQTQKFIKK